MSKCQCSMTGDGCRYCQPQKYIGWMSEWLQESQEKASSLEEERDQLKAENERLASAIRYEQHLADRIGTHGPDCWSWGNAHYECLKRKHQQDVGESILERDTLRKQLDEARELLEKYGYATGDADGRVDAWLEANK